MIDPMLPRCGSEELTKEIRMRKGFWVTLVLLIAALGVIAQQRTRPAAQRTQPANDLKIKYRNTISGQTSESTTMIKGARERAEMNLGYGQNLINITQCDLKRFIQLSEQNQKYIITPMQTDTAADTSQASSSAAAGGPARRGGVVTYTSTATDTGERKEMFGFTARHVKTSIAMESSPEACYPVKQKMETDGWYIDLNVGIDCDFGRAQAMARPSMPGGCQDQTRFKRVGAARTGYPLSETTTMYGPDGAVTFTSTKEVVEISRDPLDAALFDIPAGYTEAQSTNELYGVPSASSMAAAASGGETAASSSAADATESKSGGLRVGVVAIDNKTDHSVSTDILREKLIGELQGLGVEAVPLNALTQMTAEAEAKAKQCDFILFTTISALKSSKVGGMFGKITGQPGVGKSDARLDFKLFKVGESSPRLQSSATGKDNGDDASAGMAITSEARSVVSEVKKGQ
jgi:hypothetical protein